MSGARGVRAALFDLDGTLVDSLPTIAKAMVAAMRRHGHDVHPTEVIARVGPPMNLLIQEMTGLPPEQAERVNGLFTKLYYSEYIGQTPTIEGAGTLLKRVTAAGLRLGVLTNKIERGAIEMVELQGWTDHFAVIVGRDTTPHPKPAPDGAFHALERLGVPSEEAALVGDTEYDMVCGREAGLRLVIGLTGGRTAEQLFEHGATHVVTHLDQVGALLLEPALPTIEGGGARG